MTVFQTALLFERVHNELLIRVVALVAVGDVHRLACHEWLQHASCIQCPRIHLAAGQLCNIKMLQPVNLKKIS